MNGNNIAIARQILLNPCVSIILISIFSWLLGISVAQAQDSKQLKAVHMNERDGLWVADLLVENGKISGNLSAVWQGIRVKNIRCKKTKVKKDNKFKLWCKTTDTKNRSLVGDFTKATLSAQGKAGGADFAFVSGQDLEQFLVRYKQDQGYTTDKYIAEKKGQ